MSPISKATKKFLSNPKENWRKIIPYLKSRTEPYIRKAFETLRIESKSKPYPGHTELLDIINIKNGFFVVCGGNDGYGFDPTYYLEKFRGWTGIIAEPLPAAAKLCRDNRPNSVIYEVALVSNEFKEKNIDLYDCNFMSVTPTTQYDIEEWTKSGEKAQDIYTKKISVPAVTLDSLIDNLEQKQKINLLVIDVEGSEEEVLKGFNVAKHQPDFILIELHNKILKKAVESRLNNKYVLVSKIAYADYLYKLKKD